jgi:hypothetical protein
MNEQAKPVGYIYEFNCKQQLDQVPVQSDWYAIAFEHQVNIYVIHRFYQINNTNKS